MKGVNKVVALRLDICNSTRGSIVRKCFEKRDRRFQVVSMHAVSRGAGTDGDLVKDLGHHEISWRQVFR